MGLASNRTKVAAIASAGMVLLGGPMAAADCTVERRYVRGTSFRTIQCDESQSETDAAISRALESCASLDNEFVEACHEGVVESFELRREAMMRRTLKEGATLEATALLYGYTEEELSRWIADNEPADRGYSEPQVVRPDVLQVEQDIADAFERHGFGD